MTVLSTTSDVAARTLTIVTDLAAPPTRAWQLWVDPRQLERWWGPPTWPATFVQHDVTVGGRSTYYMTGPDGTQSHGWWQFTAIDEPYSLAFDDGFADADGMPSDAMPTIHGRVDLVETAAGTRLTVTSTFDSLEAMDTLTQMGMVDGMTAAMGQMDAILTS